jgi:hypothetical protein
MYFNCPELLFLFLKRMTGALTPFSYLVVLNKLQKRIIVNLIGTKSYLGAILFLQNLFKA